MIGTLDLFNVIIGLERVCQNPNFKLTSKDHVYSQEVSNEYVMRNDFAICFTVAKHKYPSYNTLE